MKRKIYRAIVNSVVGTAELTETFLRVVKNLRPKGAPLVRQRSKALILGNGPSLRDDLGAIERLAADGSVDLWCVNFFANSEAYTTLKPTHYVIADPGHWLEDITERLREDREKFLDRLERVTQWDLLFHMPYDAKGTEFAARVMHNKHIRVRFFNQTAVACRIRALLFWLYRHELAMPAPQNVLIPTLFLTILSGYERVGIVGADHSWHRDILVKDSVVMLRDPHFYDDDTELRPFYKNATETITMAEIFRIRSIVFTQYDQLSAVARAMQVDVVNSSSVSYIDSFKSRALSRFQDA